MPEEVKEPWYQPRFATCIVVILLLSSFIALNAHEKDKGVYRVYLDEAEKLCVAYRGKARGWPKVYAVNYDLDEDATTILGYPKRKFMDDEYEPTPMWINIFVAFVAFLSSVLVVESSARLIAMIPPRPKKQKERERERDEREERTAPVPQPVAKAEPQPVVAAAAALPPGRPVTAKQAILNPEKGGSAIANISSGDEAPKLASVPAPRPKSVNAIAAKRAADLKKRLVKA